MISNYIEYEKFIRDILKRINLLKKEQLIICLTKRYKNCSLSLAEAIIKSMQNSGYLLLTNDGWVMTKGVYVALTEDKLFQDIDYRSDCFIPKNMDAICKTYNTSVVNCMWLVADVMPYSDEFILANKPWDIVFVKKPEDENDKAILYELIYIPKKDEQIMFEALENVIDSTKHDVARQLRRIAVLDDAENAEAVPHLGFTHIVCLDENSPAHFKLVEKREGEDIWN